MALRVKDSFDFYSANTDLFTLGEWTNQANMQFNATTRFTFGKSVLFSSVTAWVYRTGLAASSATIYCAFANYNASLNGSSGSAYQMIQFFQGGSTTVQFEIFFLGDGSIQFKRGGTVNSTSGGTVVATTPTGMHSGASHQHFQFKIVINGTTGEIHVRKNGNTSDDFTATGLNTQSTGSATTDGVGLTTGTGNAIIDDFYHCDDTGTDNNTWPGDIRSYTFTPNGNASAAFTAGSVPTTYASNGGGTSKSVTANTMYFAKVTATRTGDATSVGLSMFSAGTGHVLIGLYSDTSGTPGTLLGSGSAAITNPAGITTSVSLASSVPIVNGLTYWIGILTDATMNFNGATSSAYSMGQTYGSGLPSVAAASFHPTQNLTLFLTVGYSNWQAVNDIAPDGDTTYNYSSTIGAPDLLTIPALPSTPSAILAVVHRSVVRKSDAGSRSGQTVLKSGGTTVTGASTVLGTSYGGLNTTYTTDPNTSAAWTAAAVNSLNVGYQVSA